MESDWIEYYCRDKLFTKVIEVAQKSGGDAKWRFYRGLALVLWDKTVEGINFLEPLLSHSEFGLASAHLSLIAHQSCEDVDKDAVTHLEWKVEEGSGANERSLQYAAAALLHAGSLDKVRNYVDRLLRLNSASADSLVLSGWFELYTDNKRGAARAFKAALNLDNTNVEATLGEVTTLAPADAISRLNQLIVRYPKCAPPLVEKMRLQLSVRDWPQALDTAARVLTLESTNLAALELRALHHLVVEGSHTEGLVALRRYRAELEVVGGEEALVSAAQLFSRICSRHSQLLVETSAMAEKANENKFGSAQALLELATQHRLCGKLAEAGKLYRQVTKLNPTGTESLTGLTATQLAQSGPTDQVLQQVEFLMEVCGSSPTPELLLLKAQCQPNAATTLDTLDQAVALVHSTAAPKPYGPHYLRSLNPDLLLQLVTQYPESKEGLHKRVSVLRQLVEACPGLTSVSLSLARAYTTLGDHSKATQTVQHVLTRVDSTNTEAHLILAQIHLAQDQFNEANSSLELGLSYNLQVRERPLYHVLLGAIQRYHGDNTGCVQSMRTALQLNKGDASLSMSELGTLYLEMVAALTADNHAEEASQVLREAQDRLSGSDQECRLTVARAQLASVRGDHMAALALLGTIMSDHAYFLQARKKMAEIHLHKLKDGRAFAECYKELVSQKPSTENLILLGDAYMAIQEPELAVETYEKAMKSSSSDPKLSAQLGKILVRTHQYGKAIKCFKDAGTEGSMELAQLLVRLGQLEAAEATLSLLPNPQKAMLLAKVKEKSGDIPGAMQVIKESREGLGPSEVTLNAKMCAQLAEYASASRDHDTAISYYKRALQYKPKDTRVEIALAKLYMQVNDWSSCQSLCSSLLSRDPDNEPALLMLADLAYRRVDYQDAASHFSALLARRPDHWVALARLIEVKRRTAQLSDAKPFLEAAAETAAGEPGLSYCTGLLDWYSGDVNSALHHFNNARGDGEWGQQAVHNMVEICLAGEEPGTGTATRLLAQMRPHSGDEENSVRLLHNLILLASRDKQDVDLAMTDLTQLAQQETLRVGATYGLGTGYMMQKQVARARNILKRVAKATWTVEEAEYLERCWLLLADLQVQAGKHDAASELLRRTLTHNQGCHRARQLLALIAEKEQKYLEAGLQYKQAWKLSGKNDPALGFKLAFNQVKAKRYADAISTCHAVLQLNPDYPRIRKEILDKAMNHLRT
ncbi:tetratricopeptide repeat protein 21B-like [Macrosteles quadrilineatus]|uniref:tetratricopeptide repeat protein 21B-like n=1 Tax=Macrosteles quadrilineatus TaxID=74068 RepID=UPI0023E15D94|nr:tetratricopeptide repeat protein 21B-like [Macrosteles quadrilineatus]